MKGPVLLLVFLLIIPTTVFAQQPDCRHRIVPVNVVDEKNVPVAGFVAGNFRGKFRGAPVRIVSARLDAGPRRIVILFDLSGSMRMQNQYLVAEVLAWRILRTFPDDSQIALITFADQVKIASDFTWDNQSRANLASAISRLPPSAVKGRTRLWDAVAEAVKLLTPPRQGDAIFATTDGVDSASKKHMSDVEPILLRSGIRFFASLVSTGGSYRTPAPEVMHGVTELLDLAEKSGGTVLKLPQLNVFASNVYYDASSEEQQTIFKAADPIFKQMQQFYSLEVELASEVDKPRSWKLELVPSNQHQIKGLSLHYPQKLFPCSIAKEAQPAAPK